MIFDNSLSKLEKFISQQDSLFKQHIELLESKLITGFFDLGAIVEWQKENDFFQIYSPNQYIKKNGLYIENSSIYLKYHFEKYPVSFEKYYFFKKGNEGEVRFYTTCNLEKQEETLEGIDVCYIGTTGNKEFLYYNLKTKKLHHLNQNPENYQFILDNESNPNLREFLLITHDFDIQENPACINFLEIIHNFKTLINDDTTKKTIKKINYSN